MKEEGKKLRIVECGLYRLCVRRARPPLTRDLQIARPHHHASFAVYPAASPHAVLRNGKTEPSTCQRLHDVLLGDGCRVNSEKVRERAAEGNYRKGLNRSRTFND